LSSSWFSTVRSREWVGKGVRSLWAFSCARHQLRCTGVFSATSGAIVVCFTKGHRCNRSDHVERTFLWPPEHFDPPGIGSRPQNRRLLSKSKALSPASLLRSGQGLAIKNPGTAGPRVKVGLPVGSSVASQFTGVTLATRPPWRWIICWVSSSLSKVTKRTVLLRLCRR
jgi:hypothetical protein